MSSSERRPAVLITNFVGVTAPKIIITKVIVIITTVIIIIIIINIINH